jgi:ribosomal protein L32
MNHEIRDNKRKMAGARKLASKCNVCGKLRVRHTLQEAKLCNKKEDTGNYATRVTIMTEEEVQDAKFSKW